MKLQDRSIPPDMLSLWGMNQESLGNAELTLQAWLKISNRVQEEATAFVNRRWSRDSAALADFRQCKTPVEAMNVQMTFLTRAYADYLNEGQKLLGLFSDAARESLPGMSDKTAPAKSKRSPHRVASH